MDTNSLLLMQSSTACTKFEEAHKNLDGAIELLGDDEIKWQMAGKLVGEKLSAAMARQDALEVLVNRSEDEFASNRDFIISEIEALAKEYEAVASMIVAQMGGWNKS